MDSAQIYDILKKKLARQGLFKATMISLIIGCFVMFAVALVFWFVPISELWIVLVSCFGALLVCMAVCVPLFYFCKFRPTPASIAKRLDENYSLEERFVTELELKNDTSYLARRQREDAYHSLLLKSSTTKLALVIPLAIAILLPLSGVSAAAMTTVSSLSAAEVISGGGSTIKNIFDPEPERYINVRYVIRGIDSYGTLYEEDDMECEIDGDDDQLIAIGGDATGVTAVVLDTDYLGDDTFWFFIGWTDKDYLTMDEITDDDLVMLSEEPYRQDTEIAQADCDLDENGDYILNEDGNYVKTYYAVFYASELGDGDQSSGDGDSDDSDSPDSPEDSPSDSSDSSSSDGSQNDSSSSGDSAGTGKTPSEQVVDGTQNYRDRYDEYYAQAMQILENGGEIPEWLKEIVKTYYGILL